MVEEEERFNLMDYSKKTAQAYGLLWGKNKSAPPVHKCHFESMRDLCGDAIARGPIGIDVGSGCGYDTFVMARDNPAVKVVSMDISNGVYKTRELTRSLRNVWILKGSTLNIPARDTTFYFAYSFGVLHHTISPEKSLLEISRVLKKDGPVFLYLYEKHSDNPIKYFALKIVALLRTVTIKLPPRLLYIFSVILSPFIFIVFSLPAKVLMSFKATRCLAEKLPFNFGANPFSLWGDIYDRFSAPLEFRFEKAEVLNLLNECGFKNITITRFTGGAGWVAWGYKA